MSANGRGFQSRPRVGPQTNRARSVGQLTSDTAREGQAIVVRRLLTWHPNVSARDYWASLHRDGDTIGPRNVLLCREFVRHRIEMRDPMRNCGISRRRQLRRRTV